MITLDIADLVVIAGQVLGVGPDAALERIDLAAARAALAEADLAAARAALAEGEPTPSRLTGAASADAGLAAAALIRALFRHRPFPRHNQQVAAAAGLQFLALNGWRADLDPPTATLVVVEGLASGQLSPADAAAWLSPRLFPYSAPLLPHSAPRAKEASMRTRLPRLLRAVDPRPRAGIHTPVTGFMPFTDDARDVAVLAREEADRLGLDHPGSEQFLLSLIATGPGVAARALQRLGIGPGDVRQRVAQIVGQHQRQPPDPDTPLAMRVMPRAVGEAVAQGRDYIGTEHILLALFRAGDDTAAQALASLGAGEREVRGAVIAVAGGPGRIPRVPGRMRRAGPRDEELRRLRREVARLSDLLREHGIEPGEGDQKSA
jgi:Clp amino terminal domain, pathogenicity island component